MIASENVLSPVARSTLDSDFNHRYAEGDICSREYQGAKYIDELEEIVVDLAKKVFKSNYIEHRAISGALANMAVYYGLTKPGQSTFSLQVPNGAHISFREFGTAGARGLKVFSIPFDIDQMNIDMELLREEIGNVKPNIITLGGSLFLFPHPVKEIRKACDELGTKTSIHYDGAHVLGLIAGGQFQDPLGEGADVVTGSTHKTFPGPQGALMATNNEKVYRKISRAIFPGLVSNHHLGRMAPLAITLLETLEFGKEYAKQIISNAQKLAKVLDELGLDVLAKEYGYTKSHQVAVNVIEYGGGARNAVKLENVDIIANKNLIPGDHVDACGDPSGLRLGVQELTRFGMKEPQMETVAQLITDTIMNKKNEDDIKKGVARLVSEFPEPCFCFHFE